MPGPLDNLRAAIVNAANPGPVSLNAEFIAKGMNDPSVVVPATLDGDLRRAFQLGETDPLSVTILPSMVTLESPDRLVVTNASIRFFQVDVPGGVTLVFQLIASPVLPEKRLILQIATAPANFAWTNLSPFMFGWPFTTLVPSSPLFVFASEASTYTHGGQSVDVTEGGPRQTLSAGGVAVNSALVSVFQYITGDTLPNSQEFSGVLDYTFTGVDGKDDGKEVLYPAMDLRAPIVPGDYKLAGYLSVTGPWVGLTIPPPPKPDPERPTSDEALHGQMPIAYAGIAMKGIKDNDGNEISYELRAAVLSSDTSDFMFSLAPSEGSPLFTPETALKLVDQTDNFLSAVPAPLRTFLGSIGLRGITLSGQLGQVPHVGSIGVAIGSDPNRTWSVFDDPNNALELTIKDFLVTWIVLNPFNAEVRSQIVAFSAAFTMLPDVFVGEFQVEFTSTLQFDAKFEGKADLGKLLSKVSAGTITLPASVATVELSDIEFWLDLRAGSYAFGTGFDVALNFLKIDGKPVITINEGRLDLSATTPTLDPSAMTRGRRADGAKTVYTGRISGQMVFATNLVANISAAYEGGEVPVWTLSLSLGQSISLKQVAQYFCIGYALPSFLENLTIDRFAVDATIPASGSTAMADLEAGSREAALRAQTQGTTYSVDAVFTWKLKLGEYDLSLEKATVALQYDGSQSQGSRYSGAILATWTWSAIGSALEVGYEFGQPPEQGSREGARDLATTNQTIFVRWQGVKGTYTSNDKTLTFTFQDWSLGSLIQALVRTIGDADFTLDSPWDALNQIPLDGLSLAISLKSQADGSRISVNYELSKRIDLGFIRIDGFTLKRDGTTKKILLGLSATVAGPLQEAMGEKGKNLLDPNTGQDVQRMPDVPGRGSSYLELALLMLGQRVGIAGAGSFDSTQQAINALAGVPPTTTGEGNPINPTQSSNDLVRAGANGEPFYDPDRNWLIAAHLKLLKAAGVWTVDLMFVFNDPDLYALRLALSGAKAKALAGLAIDVLYKKVTDDVGLYKVQFTFPESVRNLNMGSMSMTLPQLGLEIYTNGDFLVDLGFPYNMDFSRSFSLYAIIAGIPVTGSLGLYFGKLSAATSTDVPKTTKGSFDPVLVFGVGLRIGLGYDFTKGPLKAGFALTVFGIIEGVIAPWHSYTPGDAGRALPSADGRSLLGDAVQDDYYFRVQGTLGIIGTLYARIDFAIITASLNVKIIVSLQVTYEAFRVMPIVVSASVDVSLDVKIDLGIFSISISLSFHTSTSATFLIEPSSTRAPWDEDGAELPAMRRARLLGSATTDRVPCAARRTWCPKRIQWPGEPPTLTARIAPQLTVCAPPGATSYTDQQGAFVFLLAMDAPSATSDVREATSFGEMCHAYVPWLIDALSKPGGERMSVELTQQVVLTRAKLTGWIRELADLAHPPFQMDAFLQFLSNFKFNVVTPKPENRHAFSAVEHGATLFPVFDGLSLVVPAAHEATPKPISFETYATATPAYTEEVAELLKQLAARLEHQASDPSGGTARTAGPTQSIAALVFVDAFALVGRQLLQAAADLFDDYHYPLSRGNSIDGALAWAQALGNTLSIEDVAEPNRDTPLSPDVELTIGLLHAPDDQTPGALNYTIQAADTLSTIAARYTDPAETGPKRWRMTESALILANSQTRILNAGVEVIVLVGLEYRAYVTEGGDRLGDVAAGLSLTIEQLALSPEIYGLERLLRPSASMNLAGFTYRTASSAEPGSHDTLERVAQRFGVPLNDLASTNRGVIGLFLDSGSTTIPITAVEYLSVGDLWVGIEAGDQVAQAAGMLSRFLIGGLRLPTCDGLTLSSAFLYPPDQLDYALYQLTGQQFPVPETAEAYMMEIRRADSSHGIDLSFITFDGDQTKEAAFDLTPAYQNLSLVLGYAKEGVLDPQPTLTLTPATTRTAQTFAIQSASRWATSDLARLRALTTGSDYSLALADEARSAQIQPLLCKLSGSLLGQLERRQATLARMLSPTVRELIEYLPMFHPELGVTDPATKRTTVSGIAAYAWATRVDFTIKKLPLSSASKGQRLGEAGGPTVEQGMPYTFEVVGPSAADAVLLERILTAMDSLGHEMVSDIFLLWPQGGSQATNLVSLGSTEFLAFLTRTNLSTETNPPGLLKSVTHGDVPTGIANPPNEFIRLLWELSTVRSGGYYLYVQLKNPDQGLPAAIFDETGTATLTLVVTYPRYESPIRGRLTNFTNAFVTTDSVPVHGVLQVTSVATSADGAPVRAGETLAELGTMYGIGGVRLAEVNASAALRAGAQLPISGVVRLLKPSDFAGGKNPNQVLDALAAYYSNGALQPITGAMIEAFTPGVIIAPGAALVIPSVVYIVGAGQGPGVTFESIAAYFGLSVDAIAAAALPAAVFTEGIRPLINTQSFDLNQEMGTANVGFGLVRTNLGPPDQLPVNPTEPQKKAYAKAYLYALYSNLATGFQPNVYFEPQRTLSLPVGPQHHPTSAAGFERASGDAHARCMRNPAKRRARLRAMTQNDFSYRQTLGVRPEFARINAAPPNSGSGLPSALDNPYIGVGSIAQFELTWLDVFGNTTVTPFRNPPDGYTGALSGEPTRLLFTDRLLGLSSWPGLIADYTYAAGSPDGATLVVRLRLDVDRYASNTPADENAAQRDLGIYKRIYFQIRQDYTGLGVPGVTGNAVCFTLTNSLVAQPVEVDAKPIHEFVDDAIRYLEARARGVEPALKPSDTKLLIDVPFARLPADNIVELGVSLTIQRQPVLVDPSIVPIPGGLSVTSPVNPRANDPNTGRAGVYHTFAEEFELAFASSGNWRMRVGSGLASVQDTSGRAEAVWAVRLSDSASGPGIGFQIGRAPGFFAPKPLAHSLLNQSVKINPIFKPGQQFVPSETQDVAFTGVDSNVWFESCLRAIDKFLSPTVAPHVFILDKILAQPAPAPRPPFPHGYLTEVLRAKKTLASAIGSTVVPILQDGPDDASSRAAAAERLRQALLNELSAAYSITAVTVFSVDGARGAPQPKPGEKPASYFGQPRVTAPATRGSGAASEPHADADYSFSTGKVPLGPWMPPSGAAPVDPRLTFLLQSKNIEDRSFVSVPLTLFMTHLEHDHESVPGIKDYVQSKWISLITGPIKPELGGIEFPIVLRTLPTPPTMQTQHAEPTTSFAPCPSPSDLAKWDYRFTFHYRRAAQDSEAISVEFLTSTEPGPHAGTPEDDELVRALAQFVTVYPAIEAAMATALPELGATKPEQADLSEAHFAVDAFVAIVNILADAYKTWATQPPTKAQVVHGAVVCTFEMVLVEDQKSARVDLTNIRIGGEEAVYNPQDATITCGQLTLPAPVVRIKWPEYEPVSQNTAVEHGISYRYRGTIAPTKWLTFEEARDDPERTVVFCRLDAFEYQGAWASVVIERNKHLLPHAEPRTNREFVFRTPAVRFAEPAIPSLTADRVDIDSLPGSSVEARLREFFNKLFAHGSGGLIEVTMEGRYSYMVNELVDGMPRTTLPIALLPPVEVEAKPVGTEAFFTNLALQIELWQERVCPTTENGAEVEFGLTITSGGGVQQRQPLLTVQRLFARVKNS